MSIRLAGCTILFLLAGCTAEPAIPDLQATPEDYYHTWELEAEYLPPIQDPVQWTLDNLWDSPNVSPDDDHPHVLERDLDHDGSPELFITTDSYRGMHSTTYLVFRKTPAGHLYLGCLDAGEFKVLPKSPAGESRIAVYYHAGPGVGTLSTWTNDGHCFRMLDYKEIYDGDGGTPEQYAAYNAIFRADPPPAKPANPAP